MESFISDLVFKWIGTGLRTMAAGWAGYLIKSGIMTADQTNAFVGAIVLLATLGWSAWEKYGHVALMKELARVKSQTGPAIAGYGAQGQVQKLPLVILAIVLGPIVALLLFAAPASAQTIVTKAAPASSPVCTLTNCSGFYAGIQIGEAGSNFSGGTSANQFALGGNAGYQFWNGQWFMAAEFDALYGLTQNGTIPGGGNSALWGIGGLAKIGYSLSSVFGAAANAGAQPVLPSSLQNALIAPYAILGVWDRPWGAGFATGAGVEALLANGWTFHVDYVHVNYNNAAVNPNVNQQTEDLILGGIDYHFKL